MSLRLAWMLTKFSETVILVIQNDKIIIGHLRLDKEDKQIVSLIISWYKIHIQEQHIQYDHHWKQHTTCRAAVPPTVAPQIVVKTNHSVTNGDKFFKPTTPCPSYSHMYIWTHIQMHRKLIWMHRSTHVSSFHIHTDSWRRHEYHNIPFRIIYLISLAKTYSLSWTPYPFPFGSVDCESGMSDYTFHESLFLYFLQTLKWQWARYCYIDMIHRPSYLELANFSIFSMFNTLANGFEWERGLTLAMILTIFYWTYYCVCFITNSFLRYSFFTYTCFTNHIYTLLDFMSHGFTTL